MDPLSQIVEILQPRAVAWQVVEAHAPWGLQFPASRVVIFGQMLGGSCMLDRDDGLRLDLDEGDFLLMAAPPAWTMHSPGAGPPIDFRQAFDDPSLLLRADGTGPVARFIAGRFTLALPHADLLTRLMLPVVHVRASEVERGRLGVLLRVLEDEVLDDRPGRSLVTDRLLDILLVESLRESAADSVAVAPGLLAGLTDPRLRPALRAMHDDIRHAWTVQALARRASMSRSAFSARFTRVLGTSPIDYLIGWRMTVAKRELVNSNVGMGAIAEMIGYQSVSAFSLAFSNHVGRSPTAYRQEYAQAPIG